MCLPAVAKKKVIENRLYFRMSLFLYQAIIISPLTSAVRLVSYVEFMCVNNLCTCACSDEHPVIADRIVLRSPLQAKHNQKSACASLTLPPSPSWNRF